MAVRAGGAGARRSPGWLAALLVGAEVLAVGVWALVEAAGVGQEPYLLGVYGGGGGIAVIVLWWLFARDTRTVEVVRRRENQDREARAALLRLDRMDPVRLGDHVADLCRRDGLADVEAVRVHDDAHSVDVTGTLVDGTGVVVRCRAAAGAATVSGSLVERLVEDEQHEGRTRVLATTAGGFSRKAHDLAAADGAPQLLDRRALARWDLEAEIPAALRAADSAEEEGTAAPAADPDDPAARPRRLPRARRSAAAAPAAARPAASGRPRRGSGS
ncbi:restriction endonuclease [Yinghuangia sp. YIM S09857]|uniref:restriction endonuclease n=1 Tax=Yinghuangia sp. YIM S09857 TaxID=3436929 RepID=UPI003F538C24